MVSRSRPSRPSLGTVHGSVMPPPFRRRVVPGMCLVAARRIVADHYNRDIRLARRLHRIAFSIRRVIGGVVHLHIRAHLILNAFQRRHGVRRSPAIPIPMHESASGPMTAMDLISVLSSGRKLFSFFSSTTDSSAIFRETSRSLSVFHGSGESLMFVYGHHLRRIEQSELDRDAELAAQRVVDISLCDRPSFSAALVSSL